MNSLTDDNATALHYAGQISKSIVSKTVPDEDRQVVRYLIEGGANVNLITKQVSCTGKYICSVLLN